MDGTDAALPSPRDQYCFSEHFPVFPVYTVVVFMLLSGRARIYIYIKIISTRKKRFAEYRLVSRERTRGFPALYPADRGPGSLRVNCYNVRIYMQFFFLKSLKYSIPCNGPVL